MRFVRPERVIYARNPLKQVVCQVRFDPLLAIAADQPVAFQRAVIDRYPVLEVAEPLGRMIFGTAANLESQALPSPRTYSFWTADRVWQLGLAADSLALSCTKYIRWEEFEERTLFAINAFLGQYAPPRITRIGLRYVDVVDPGALEVEETWDQFINPVLLGPAAATDDEFARSVARSIESFESALSMNVEGGKLTLRHGLGRNPTTSSTVYLIDGDFYDEEPGEPNGRRIMAVLRNFNQQAGGLFRWSIQDRLHQLLGPQPAG